MGWLWLEHTKLEPPPQTSSQHYIMILPYKTQVWSYCCIALTRPQLESQVSPSSLHLSLILSRMTGRTALAVAAGLLLVGLASALPYGHYKSPPPGTRYARLRVCLAVLESHSNSAWSYIVELSPYSDAAGFWDDYGGYYGGYPGYYGRYDDYYPLPGRGYDDLYYGGRGYGALGGEDNSIYNSEYIPVLLQQLLQLQWKRSLHDRVRVEPLLQVFILEYLVDSFTQRPRYERTCMLCLFTRNCRPVVSWLMCVDKVMSCSYWD